MVAIDGLPTGAHRRCANIALSVQWRFARRYRRVSLISSRTLGYAHA